jgi:hypothetical protein
LSQSEMEMRLEKRGETDHSVSDIHIQYNMMMIKGNLLLSITKKKQSTRTSTISSHQRLVTLTFNNMYIDQNEHTSHRIEVDFF